MTAGQVNRTLQVAFVNCMPDGAFLETEEQFGGLLKAGAGDQGLQMSCYWMPGIDRSSAIRAAGADRYFAIDDLYRSEPDAVIITGAEPLEGHLTLERYWTALTSLMSWAQASVPSMLLSCLAAHAGLLAFDDLQRSRLPGKCFGVFAEAVEQHPLTVGLEGPVLMPHSRLNEVPRSGLDGSGYSTLLHSEAAGWSVASKQRGGCLLLLTQGHPEYGTASLLREYRRDIRRYLLGERPDYPPVPEGYLDAASIGLLEEFRDWALAGDPSAKSIEHFPYEAVRSSLEDSWHLPAVTLYANWLRQVALMSGPSAMLSEPAAGR